MPSDAGKAGDSVSLKEFFETLIKERDLYYAEKIKYLETRIVSVDDKHTAAVTAVKELSTSTSAASEKAILKAEEAQKELNIKNNEFRGQLKDQADVLMPRSEALSMIKNIEEKMANFKHETDSKFDISRKDVQGLRESRSEGGGRSSGQQMSWALLLAVVGLIGTTVSVMVGISILLRR